MSTAFRVSACFFQLRQLRIIRRSLTADAAHALVWALIHTRIDYCNGLLVSCPRYLTNKLQAVLRAAARLVLQLPYRSSVSEVMHRQLHWLDVEDRMNYKICLLVCKCLHGLAPGYLSDQCIPASTFAGRANMRSSSRLDRQLYVPRTKQRYWVHKGSTTPPLLCGTRSRQTCMIPDFRSTPSEQNWNPTFSQLINFFVFLSCMYVLYYVGFFAVRANVMFISWRVQMSELNWIEI